MAVSAQLFDNALDQLASGITYSSDTIKLALLATSAPALSTTFFNSVTTEIAGTGYSAGGVTLGTKTHVVTAANSWGVSRANSTPYNVGDVYRPATGNTFLYVCTEAGTSNASIPTFKTIVGESFTDGTAVFSCLGSAITVWSSAAASWTTATFSADFGVIYKSTGTASTSPMLGLITFGTTESPSAGTLTLTPNASTGWFANARA